MLKFSKANAKLDQLHSVDRIAVLVARITARFTVST